MNDRERRIARARLLRREGKTYDEIRAVIGSVDDATLRTWLRGIPRPRATRRSSPKTELRLRCRQLRAQGYTYTEIAALTGASKGSISPWVRDVRVWNRDRAERRRLKGLRAAARTKSGRAQRKREMDTRLAAASIGPLNERDVFLLGIALYWAEGSKSKPYDVRERLTFVNSDPTMIQVFMAWLALLGIDVADCRFRVQIHETASVESAERFWADLVGVHPSKLSRTTLKRHRPLTNRRNVNEAYRGCLVVSVVQSAAAYRSVAGWWEGVHRQVACSHFRSPGWSDVPPWQAWRQLRRKLELPIPGCSVGRGDETLNLGTT